jgi:PiT family inorganic phosphate transporter
MDHQLAFVILIIAVALIFDFLNGFHDAANSIATIVSTRVLRPQQAVVWAAFFNFIAFLFFGLHVANTVGKGIIDPSIVDPHVILSALSGAIFWNIFTWYYGIPSSSSHALIGGLIGAAIVKSGPSALIFSGIGKTALYIVISPTVGFIFAYIIMHLVILILHRTTPVKVDAWFRKLQLVSASLYSLGHGGNDAQKTMGIIAVLLYSTGYLKGEFDVLSCCHGDWNAVWRMAYR